MLCCDEQADCPRLGRLTFGLISGVGGDGGTRATFTGWAAVLLAHWLPWCLICWVSPTLHDDPGGVRDAVERGKQLLEARNTSRRAIRTDVFAMVLGQKSRDKFGVAIG